MISWKISSNWFFQRNVGSDVERAQTSEDCSTLLAGRPVLARYSWHSSPSDRLAALNTSRTCTHAKCADTDTICCHLASVVFTDSPQRSCSDFAGRAAGSSGARRGGGRGGAAGRSPPLPPRDCCSKITQVLRHYIKHSPPSLSSEPCLGSLCMARHQI